MTSLDVCVRGGGAVGSTLALALSSMGLRVAQVVDAAARPAQGDIRAYALNARSQALLARLRVWDALPAGAVCRVSEMRVCGDAGGQLDFTAWQQCETQLAWIVDAGALDEALAQALRYAPGVERVAAPVAAALTAVCEGARSSSREAFNAGFVRHPYPHTAVATRLQSDTPHCGAAWQWFRSPDVLALLPIHLPQPGCSYGLVWSVPHHQAQQLIACGDAEFEAALNAAVASSVDPAATVQPGHLTLAGPRASWPLALGRASLWCGPGWVLLGDAAHQVHPLAGQGLNLGLADVDSLVRVLGQARQTEAWRSLGDEKLLRRYVRERAASTWAMATTTDTLLHLFANPSPPVRALRNRGMSLLNRAAPLKRWLIGQALDVRR